MMPTREKLSGRRLSLCRETTFDDAREALIAMVASVSFEEYVKMKVERARELLRSKGLPDTDRRLDDTLEIQFGIVRDSFEHLAAQLIVAAEDMSSPHRDIAILGAFHVGRLDILIKAYSDETMTRRLIGSKPKRRRWAEDLARILISRGAQSPRAARAMIPESYSPLHLDDDHYVYIGKSSDGNDIVICGDAVSDATISTLRWTVFQKNYFRLALTGQKRR